MRRWPTPRYFVDKACFTPENLLKVVSLEPYDELPIDDRWIPHRAEDDPSKLDELHAIIDVDVPFGEYSASSWYDLCRLVQAVETYPLVGGVGTKKRIEYVTEVYRDDLAAVGITAKVRWIEPVEPAEN